jgi:hypothetical protein
MIGHAVMRVQDLKKSRRVHEAALQPLGYGVVREFPGFAGLGASDKPELWIGRDDTVTKGVHLALASRDRKAVDAFHAAALKTGGKDHGAPGLRAHPHPHYYGAFILDLEGNNIEAVCHDPKG